MSALYWESWWLYLYLKITLPSGIQIQLGPMLGLKNTGRKNARGFRQLAFVNWEAFILPTVHNVQSTMCPVLEVWVRWRAYGSICPMVTWSYCGQMIAHRVFLHRPVFILSKRSKMDAQFSVWSVQGMRRPHVWKWSIWRVVELASGEIG